MQYGNMNLLHQQGLRINYIKSKQSFDVHFESVQTQSLLFNTELKSGWIRMYMCYIDSIRRPSFAGNPEWSDFSPVLMAIDWSVYCKSNKSQLQGSLHKCAGWLLPLMPSSLHTGFLDSWQTGSSKSSQTKWQSSRELLKSVIYYQIL